MWFCASTVVTLKKNKKQQRINGGTCLCDSWQSPPPPPRLFRIKKRFHEETSWLSTRWRLTLRERTSAWYLRLRSTECARVGNYVFRSKVKTFMSPQSQSTTMISGLLFLPHVLNDVVHTALWLFSQLHTECNSETAGKSKEETARILPLCAARGHGWQFLVELLLVEDH